MKTLNIVLQVVCFIAAMAVFFRVEPVLNQMGRQCRFVVRLAWNTLALGAFSIAALILLGNQPSISETLMAVGIALVLIYERRLNGQHRLRKRSSHTKDVHHA